MDGRWLVFFILLGLIALGIVLPSLRLCSEWQRKVVLRLGRYVGVRGPGLFFLLPYIETSPFTVDMRLVTDRLQADQTLTKDGASLTVETLVYWRVLDAGKATVAVVDYARAVQGAAQGAIRDIIGRNDLATMLETGYLGGKCADLNALFVGLARAAGLPARDVYGIRCAASKEFKSLGRADDITSAQHCRAEVYLTGYGWVPVDPADVRKVVLEENAPGDPLSLDEPTVQRARAKLFGAWEMNWLPYNYAHDVRLPHATGPELGFLMYPQTETAKGRKDSLDAKHFTYTITAKEI
ncbi:MAG TPA: SPFH domain-containing protein [Candidatus Binatia bacterium]|jgi:transglutaminase-like putative cysteine protease|nr:SPFH domain-containing protein [Candidatus Binatia bacterium]